MLFPNFGIWTDFTIIISEIIFYIYKTFNFII